MLLKLNISNFAIIKSILFEPSKSLNIITGETGAGKSIILDALGLILGSRADIKTNVGNELSKNGKCVVEGVFLLDRTIYEPLFEALELDFEEETIIRREIAENGKSRNFINDTPVSLNQIKSITNSMISIHSQHENSHLTEREFQFNLLDAYAGILPQVVAYQSKYTTLKRLKNDLNVLKEQQTAFLKEKDYLIFLLEEFEHSNLQPDEEEALENELKLLSNAESIELISENIIQSLIGGELTVTDTLSRLKTSLKSIADVNSLSRELYERISSAIIELKDIASEAGHLKEAAMPDGKRLEDVNGRLQLIQNLKRKHGIANYNDLLTEKEKLSEKLFAIGNTDNEIHELERVISKEETSLTMLSETLHQARISNTGQIENEIKLLLAEMEMPDADIRFEINSKTTFDEYGHTNLNILFSANIGMPLQLLSKVASGGELSRLALCFRSIEAANSNLSTLIFDEIDTGVSGKVADTIGTLFEKLSSKHQVIAITHLPQVASYGKSHFMIGKRVENNKTVSYLKKLDKEERVAELAKMLSGNVATEIARKNAIELLKN